MGVREEATTIRHVNGWLQWKVPLPFSLKWVNSYLLPDADGWTVIDPGLRSADTELFWERSMREAGIGWGDIRKIVLTHHHPDHYGLSGWLQERSGAPVYLSETARRYAQRLWGEGETFSRELVAALVRHGLPDELLAPMREHVSGVFGQVLPHPASAAIRPLPAPGTATFRMAGAEWELIGGEGHAPGHVSFYDPATRFLLCGDQVLPDITPNIGWMPDADPDPLGSYLASLRAMLPLDIARAYPGHRDPFEAFGERVERLLAFHDRRLRQMADLLAEAGPMTAFELSGRLFGERVRGNAHHLRFAMAETVAHLIRLEHMGLAVALAAQEGASELVYWRRSAAD